MSLCLLKYIDENNLVVAGDSRACGYDDLGNAFIVNDTTEKIIPIDKKTILFISGFSEPLKKTVEEFKKGDITVNRLASLFRKNMEDVPKQIQDKCKQLSAILMFTIEHNKLVYYVITTAYGYVPIMFDIKKGNKAIIGWYEDDIQEKYYKKVEKMNNIDDVISLFANIYQESCCYEVGGVMNAYVLSSTGISQKAQYKICDYENFLSVSSRIYNTVFNLKGLNINDRFSIDENGAVTINGGSISFNSINGLEDVLTDIENKIPTLPDYLKSTYIDGTSVNAPVIRGGTIAGIVFTDLDENTQLILNPQGSHSTVSDLLLTNSSGAEVFKIHDGIGEATLSMYDVPVLRVNTQNDRGVLLNCDVVATFG